MNSLQTNNMISLKKVALVILGIVILVMIYFSIRRSAGASEGERGISRIREGKGQPVITLTKDELLLNGFKVETPEAIMYQPFLKMRGWRIGDKELEFYISSAQLAKIPDAASYAYIEMQADQDISKEIPEKLSVNFGNQLSVEAERVDVNSELLTASKFLYRVPENKMPEKPVEEVIFEIPEGPSMSASLVSESAVVWSDGKAWVYSVEDSGGFIRREIKILKLNSQDFPKCQNCILVHEDEQLRSGIVVQGAQQLLSEEVIAEIGESAE